MASKEVFCYLGPEWRRLLVAYHIAPLLQVNLEVRWQNCRRDDGVVEITGNAIRDFIDTHEAVLDHYLSKVRERVTSEQVDDQRNSTNDERRTCPMAVVQQECNIQ